MSQNYTEFPNTDTLNASHAKIIDNYKSFRSLNAGVTFPATLLYDGTPCWRTDLNKLYIYDGISAWQDLVPGYTHPSYATTNIDTTGATIIDSITTTAEGHISAMTTRVLTVGDLGALAAGANAVSATKLLTTRAISLSGDVTGTVNFDGTAAVNIVATVANDSHTHSTYALTTHTHTTANVTGLDTALAAKAALASPALTGTPTTPTAATATNNTQIASTAFTRAAITAYAPTTNVATAIAALAFGGVGTYALLITKSTTNVAVGATSAGSLLRYVAGEPLSILGSVGGTSLTVTSIGTETALSGTWRNMGAGLSDASSSTSTIGSNGIRNSINLWLRIS
jgi:hypothetical protein